MQRLCLILFFQIIGLLFSVPLSAQAPNPAFLLQLSHSIAKVHIYNQTNQLGVGSSVVVAKNQVATNCHVVANARGIAINKLGNSYAPISMKADWEHDLCILIFERLPLKPLALGHLDTLNDYELPIISVGFSGSSPRPTRSYGHIKAMIPYDNSHVIESSSGFSLGASGGALINYKGELLGITTFKSPGKHGHYFSLPVHWIEQLLHSDKLVEPTDARTPFWDAPTNKRPTFMQAVSHMESQNWLSLKKTAINWTKSMPNNPEAWFYLGTAEQGLNHLNAATAAFKAALNIAPKHTRSLYSLGVIAYINRQNEDAKRIGGQLESINPTLAEQYFQQVHFTD